MHKKLHVALVSNSSWSIYNYRLGLVEQLLSLGIQVTIIASKDQFSSRLIKMGCYFVPWETSYNINPLLELGKIAQLVRQYQRNRFDFVFHYTAKPNIYGSLAAFLCGVPSISIVTGLGLVHEHKKRFTAKLLLNAYRIAAKLSNELWFLNKEDRDFFLEAGVTRVDKTQLLPSEGINIQWFQPQEQATKADPAKKVRFLMACRILWSKGIKELIEAARFFKGQAVQFELLGFVVPEHPDGVTFKEIQQWDKQGIIRYIGEDEDVRPYIQATDCVVLPSYGEGVPRILLEAAGMGKPIITTDIPGCRDVVEDGINGFLCKPADSQSFIWAIERFLLLSQEERNKMGTEGRKKVLSSFDEELVVDQYLRTLFRYFPGVVPAKKAVGS